MNLSLWSALKSRAVYVFRTGVEDIIEIPKSISWAAEIMDCTQKFPRAGLKLRKTWTKQPQQVLQCNLLQTIHDYTYSLYL